MTSQPDSALHSDAANPSRREQILRAAAQLFAERGSRAVGVDDVGAAVGVTGPAIYRHFASKDAMLAEMLLRISERLLAGGAEVIAAAGDSPTAQLRALVDFQVDFALDNPALITVQDRDLGALSDRDLQMVLKEADSSRLTVALKGATQTLRDKFMKNMSSRAAALLADDLAAMGAVKLALVEKAQGEIAAVALSLAEREKITIVRPADKML